MSKEKKTAAKPAPKKMRNDSASALILNYMNQQNRPYNNKMVFENIHGKDVGLSQQNVTDRLAALAKEDSLSSKVFKNKPIYWAKQDRHEIMSPVQIQEKETEIKALKEKDTELKKQVAELKRMNDSLSAEPTDAELATKLAETKAECAKLAQRLDVVKGNSKSINPQEKKQLEAKYELVRKEWRSRKRKDICDTFEENGALDAKKLKKLKTELDIQTDEDVKVSIDDDKTSKLLKSATAKK